MGEVPATPTPVTESQAVSLLVELFPMFFGQDPPEAVAIYTLALAWVETNHGQSLIQHNAGNVSCRDDGVGWSGDFWRPPWFSQETSGSGGLEAWTSGGRMAQLHERMLKGEVPRAFRAYPTAIEGWNDFLREVLRRKSLVRAMASDDPAAVVRELHDTNYSKDYGPKHVATFASLASSFRSRGDFAQFKGMPLPPEFAAAPGVSSSSGSGGGSALVFVALVALFGWAAVLSNPKMRRKLVRA